MIKSVIKKRILHIYLVSLSIALALWGVSLHHDWKHFENDSIEMLTEQATVTNDQLESALLDASRLVDSARAQFEAKLKHGDITDGTAHQILQETVDGFKFYKTKSVFGLLFYIDKNGVIRAENSAFPAPHIDVSDRLYFQKIVADRSRGWYVGDQVIGRRNNQRVFHYVAPLTGKSGEFAGVLLQQINLDEISKLHLGTGIRQSIRLLAFQSDGYLSFEHPYSPVAPPDVDSVRQFRLQLFNAAQENKDEVSIQKEAGATPTSYYLGCNQKNIFGLMSMAYMPTSAVKSAFVEAQSTSLLIAILGWLLITYLFYRLSKETRATEQAYENSLLDPLTNIHNRRALDDEFPRLWRNAKRNHESMAVAFIDIDHFKRFNDSYGHEAGDKALLAVAKVLSHCIQRPLDFICRWGGEEFVIVLPNTDSKAALDVIECVMSEIRSLRIEVDHSQLECLTVSIGLAVLQVSDTNFKEDLIDMADKAMLKAKAAGRNCYRIFE